MSDSKIFVQTNTNNPRNIVELLPVGGDITAPTFTNISNGNPRFEDAKTLLMACSRHINTQVKPKVAPNVLFVYRSVAIGGLQRNLGGFSSKPLTVKNKSIDPTLLQGNPDFEQLTGLVPIQVKLGKNGQATNNTTIELSGSQAAYFITKVQAVGNTKSYLCCNQNDRTLSWENTLNPAGKILCTFLGDSSNPYLADWDLVIVGVSSSSIIQDNTLSNYKVIDNPTASVPHNVLPQWLKDCLANQSPPVSNHVTQHGPESLYCGNRINDNGEQFLILYGSEQVNNHTINANSPENGNNPFAKLENYLSRNFNGYLLYKFPGFDGSGNNQPADFANAINAFNATIVK